MDFRFDVSEVIQKPISVFSADELPKHPKQLERLVTIIDELGLCSAKAQQLKNPITSLVKLRQNPDQRLYIMRDERYMQPMDVDQEIQEKELLMFGCQGVAGYRDMIYSDKYVIVGMLKVGTKRLFVNDESGRTIDISPLCVLDFYIDETYQRQGYGKRLFKYMLDIEFTNPSFLAYDRPSKKLFGFLKKHYKLTEYVPQNNNFVIFKQFGLEHLEIDSKGRPKQVQYFRTKSQALAHKQQMRGPEGLSKQYGQFKTMQVNDLTLETPQDLLPPIPNKDSQETLNEKHQDTVTRLLHELEEEEEIQTEDTPEPIQEPMKEKQFVYTEEPKKPRHKYGRLNLI